MNRNAQELLPIVPLRSLGCLDLGMKASEVKTVMNEKQKWEPWMGGNMNGFMMFHGLILEFSPMTSRDPQDDAALHEIELNVEVRDDFSFYGKRVSSWTRSELLRYLESNLEQRIVNGPERDLVLPDLGLEMSFDEADKLCYLAMCLPAKTSWIDRLFGWLFG